MEVVARLTNRRTIYMQCWGKFNIWITNIELSAEWLLTNVSFAQRSNLNWYVGWWWFRIQVYFAFFTCKYIHKSAQHEGTSNIIIKRGVTTLYIYACPNFKSTKNGDHSLNSRFPKFNIINIWHSPKVRKLCPWLSRAADNAFAALRAWTSQSSRLLRLFVCAFALLCLDYIKSLLMLLPVRHKLHAGRNSSLFWWTQSARTCKVCMLLAKEQRWKRRLR
jgi:hypothetical protein